jgi:uncharacterized NAD(P)/FAD-binding protein YdhS
MKSVTIIGSGASGTLLAINLIKNHTNGNLKITLFEKDSNKFTKGIAYSTNELSHLLNVRVAAMSIFKDDPDHFFNWLKSNGYHYEKTDFVPRKIFGNYISSTFHETVFNGSNLIEVHCVNAEVNNIQKVGNKWCTVYKEPENPLYDKVNYSDDLVFAIGNISVSEVDLLKYSNINNYFRSPWSGDFYDKVKSEDSILIIGNGLTSADVILSLYDRNHTGNIYSISRRGYLPLNHKIIKPYPSFYNELEGKDINEIFSIIKKHLNNSDEPRSVIDSIRPHTQTIWKNLSKVDKSRFLRHLNHYWNIIRHRMPEVTGYTMSLLVDDGSLKLLTGSIISIEDGEVINVKYYDKISKKEKDLKVHKIINCIGPESNYNKIKMPLIKNTLTNGLIDSDDNNISIKVNDWNIIDKDGNIQQGLYGIGPILKGNLFESTAIPEIKNQAYELANKILNEDSNNR